MILVSLRMYTKYVLKIFVKRECLERCLFLKGVCVKFFFIEQVLKILPTLKKIVRSRFL